MSRNPWRLSWIRSQCVKLSKTIYICLLPFKGSIFSKSMNDDHSLHQTYCEVDGINQHFICQFVYIYNVILFPFNQVKLLLIHNEYLSCCHFNVFYCFILAVVCSHFYVYYCLLCLHAKYLHCLRHYLIWGASGWCCLCQHLLSNQNKCKWLWACLFYIFSKVAYLSSLLCLCWPVTEPVTVYCCDIFCKFS